MKDPPSNSEIYNSRKQRNPLETQFVYAVRFEIVSVVLDRLYYSAVSPRRRHSVDRKPPHCPGRRPAAAAVAIGSGGVTTTDTCSDPPRSTPTRVIRSIRSRELSTRPLLVGVMTSLDHVTSASPG